MHIKSSVALLVSLLTVTTATPVVKRAVDNVGGGDHGGGAGNAGSSSSSNGPTVRPVDQPDKCLGLASTGNGNVLILTDCTTGLNQWNVSPGDNQVVRLTHATDFCLDAGLDFTSGNANVLKIWQCYPGLPQQRWWLTDDGHLAVTNGNACATLQDDGSVVTKACGQPGQTFNVVQDQYQYNPQPQPQAGTLRPTADSNTCLGVARPGDGNVIITTDCTFGLNDWNLARGANQVVQLTSYPEFCLDAGSDFTSGNINSVQIRSCSPGSPQQSWYLTDDDHLAVVGGNACLTIVEGGEIRTRGCGQPGQTFNRVDV